MNRSPAEIRDRWLNYGRRYAVHPTLWDSSLAFASGPLSPEAGTLHDYSERTSGAVWSVGAGDVPKYTQASVRGGSFFAGQYDGSNDYALTSYTPNINPSTASWSLATWVKPSVAGLVAFVGTPTGTNQRFYFAVHGGSGIGDKWRIVTSASAVGDYLYSVADIVWGKWTHFAAVVSGGSVSMYIDGAYDSTLSGLDSFSTTGAFSIGAVGAGVIPFPGSIAATSMFTRAITQNEIAILATHPLAAFEVSVPKYYTFSPAGGTHLWPWQIRRSRRVRGKR